MVSQQMLSNLMRKFHKHFHGINYNDIENYFKFSQKEKLFCEYCGIELQEISEPPYTFAPSLDHKNPKSRGGENSFDNIAICCHRCNIIKGTMTDTTFKKMLELLNKEPLALEQIMQEAFKGRFADKLRRENKQPKELWQYV